LRSNDILADPTLLATDNDLRQHALALQQKSAVGESVFSADYHRMSVFAVEAEGVLGDFVLRFDAGFTPRQTFYTTDGTVVARPASRGVLGAEYTYGDTWFVQVTGFAEVVHDPPKDALLLLIDNAETTEPGRRAVAMAYGGEAVVRWSWQDWQAMATGLYTLKPGDYVLIGEVSYVLSEPHTIRAGALFIGGNKGSTAYGYRMNDFAYVEYAVSL
jgi:hypothetical protein